MCVTNSCSCGKGNKCPVAYPTFPGSLTGNDGWEQTIETVVDNVNLDPDGQYRVVHRVTGWVGGGGTAPTAYVGQYLTSTGYTTVLASAQNYRGAKGDTGNATGVWTTLTQANYPIGVNSFRAYTVDGVSVFTATSLNASTVRYMRIGKTMFLNFSFDGVATVSGAPVNPTFRVEWDIHTPLNLQANTNADVGFAVLKLSGGNCEMQYPNLALAGVCHTLSTDVFHVDTGLVLNTGGAVTTNFNLFGSLVFETI